jgi:hypothetical protein
LHPLVGNNQKTFHAVNAIGRILEQNGQGALAYDAAGKHAQAIANHESPKTTKHYDRTGDQIDLDESEKIQI